MPDAARWSEFETRFVGAESGTVVSEDRRIRGYAVVFNVRSLPIVVKDVGVFQEIILPEAADRTLREGIDVRAYVNHDPVKVLGRKSAGTLRLDKDGRGLRAEIMPPDTTYAQDLMKSMARGDITGMSFKFKVPTGGDHFYLDDGMIIREVSDCRISEVTVCGEPAYLAASASVRSMQEFMDALPGKRSRDWFERKLKAGLR
jgi:hypothetical protein